MAGIRHVLADALKAGIIKEEDVDAGLHFHITGVVTCPGCSFGGTHASQRNDLTRRARKQGKTSFEWSHLERAYRQKLNRLNKNLERFGLSRAFLCLWESEEDRKNCDVYNLLEKEDGDEGEETYEMLKALRFGAPFLYKGKYDMTYEEAQVAAAATFLVHPPADMTRKEILGLVAISAITNDGNSAEVVERVQSKLPRHMRLTQAEIGSVKPTFEQAEDMSDSINSPSVPKNEKSKRLQDFFAGVKAGKSEIEEEVRRKQTAKQRAWGLKDKAGKLWRLKGNHWERLSMRLSVSRTFTGEPIFTPKIKHSYPAPPSFVPDIDFDEQLRR